MEHKREPRGIAYFSEDPEFRDNIYEKGKDAYIQLGGISYPDIFEGIYKECGFHYDENEKDWVGGDKKKLKQIATDRGLRKIGKILADVKYY